MILGRNAGLWAGLVQAGLNLVAAIIVAVTNTPMSAADVAAFAAANSFGLVVVALIANASDPSTVPTFALTTQPPAAAGGATATSSSAASSIGSPSSAIPTTIDPLTLGSEPAQSGDTAAPIP